MSSGSTFGDGSNSLSEGSHNQEMPIGPDGVYGSDRLQELAAGIEQIVRIGRKGILEKVMVDLGARLDTEYTVIDCPDTSVKVAIKLDLSGVTSVSGERLKYSVIESEPFMNYNDAQASAVQRAFKYLQENYMIKIVDFSSRATRQIEMCDADELLAEGINCIDKLMSHWDSTVAKCKLFSEELRHSQFCDYFGGQLSEKGKVYGLVSDKLTCLLVNIQNREDEIKSELAGVKSDRQRHEEHQKKQGHDNRTEGPYKEIVLASRDLLECVLAYYGLEGADYINTPESDGWVKSTVTFTFPYFKNFRYGGKIGIAGRSYSSQEAEEEAAYKALVFIEKNFKTNVADFNYTKRKNASRSQNKIMMILSKTIHIAECMNTMFGKLISGVKGQSMQFSFDPNSFFSGENSAGQIDAYRFCANGLNDLDQYTTNLLATSEEQFQKLGKLNWEMSAAKNNLLL